MAPYSNLVIPVKTGISSHGVRHENVRRTSETGSIVMTLSTQTLRSDPRVAEILKARFGHDGFLPLQQDVIDNVLAGGDSIVLMPTGSGKSLCYQLPALLLDGVTLVVSPLIALMKNQVDSLTAKGVRAAFINGTMSYAEILNVQNEARSGLIDILYVSPERLAVDRFREFLRTMKIGLIAIDEAHCISEWGHDFRPDYRNLRTLRDEFPNAPVMALTATATEKVREDVAEQMDMVDAPRFVTSFNRANLTYRVRPKRRSFETLVQLLRSHQDQPAIIYCFSRKDTEELAKGLSHRGFKALPYHAGLQDDVRRETQDRFLSDDVHIIAATIAFGMGIDKPNIRLVVHYDLPKTMEGYYQETGRAGRDGQPSECVLFFSHSDKMKQKFFIRKIEDAAERENAEARLEKMVEYGAATTCRRRLLLEYFDETWKQDNCAACDVSLSEEPAGQNSDRVPESSGAVPFDGTEIAQKVLSAVVRTGGRFGATHIVGVLRGSRSKRVLELGHDKLTVYGIAREISRHELRDMIDQLAAKGLLAVATGDYPTLDVTESGKKSLKSRETVTLVRHFDGRSVQSVEGGAANSVLNEKLRVARRNLASERGIPAYIVFGNATLREMTSSVPQDRDALMKIKGFGPTRYSQFGDHFLSVIADHVASNGHISNGRPAATPGSPETDPAMHDPGPAAKAPDTRNAEVSEEDARMALAAYESAMNARQEADQARRQALDTLEAWLLQKDIDHAPLPGQAKERLVKLVRTTRRSVDYEKLDAALDPEIHAEIVTERVVKFVRVE